MAEAPGVRVIVIKGDGWCARSRRRYFYGHGKEEKSLFILFAIFCFSLVSFPLSFLFVCAVGSRAFLHVLHCIIAGNLHFTTENRSTHALSSLLPD